MDRWTAQDEQKYVRLTCANMVDEQGAFRCEGLTKAGLVPGTCVDSFVAMRASATTDPQVSAFRMIIAGLSMAQSCDEVAATFRLAVAEMNTPEANQNRPPGCQRRPDGAFALTQADAANRRGLRDRTFTETTSSLQGPIEVCGVRGELEWLTRVSCQNGSHPFGNDLDKAHAARAGTKPAQASRCPSEPSPIDRYVVRCPEGEYQVYMDMYECGPGEKF
jgi:hypothetical protein